MGYLTKASAHFDPQFIRYIALLGASGHGKSSLMKALDDFKLPVHDDIDMNETRYAYGQSFLISFDPQHDDKHSKFLLNIFDTPGRSDLFGEIPPILQVSDGCLLVIDCAEGVTKQTKMCLEHALSMLVKPSLFVNKIDRMIFELEIPVEEIYLKITKIIEDLNSIIGLRSPTEFDSLRFDPKVGNVIFGSALDGWAFSIEDFARMYPLPIGPS